MNTYSRRSLLALAGVAALGTVSTHATSNRIGMSGRPLYSCGAVMGTPEIVHVDSDIPFEKAYIDTTIPYHESALKLVELNKDDLEDERLIEIADAILQQHPKDIEELKSYREEWFGSAETDEPTKEMMLLSMGGLESCSDQSHLDFLDAEWVEETWEKNDDHLFAFVSMLVLAMEMEHHQHMVGLQLAEHEELKDFCQRMHETAEPQIKTLKTVRGELINRY
jgi:uncharacterized protein (DUF305 family)